MGVASCDACGRPVHPAAARCPHCGAVRPEVAGRPLSVSVDEARALIATEEAARPRAAEASWIGSLGRLLLPDTSAEGARYVAEIALSLAALPVAIGSAFLVLMLRRARRVVRPAMSGVELAFLAVTGALSTFYLLDLMHVPTTAAAAIAIGSASSLAVRAVLRSSSTRARSRDLSRLDPAPPPASAPPRAQLPAARVVSTDEASDSGGPKILV